MANKRLREILTAFSAVGWSNLKDRKKPLDEKKAPKQLREAFEQLGPSFVKIGQILSTRSDLLPEIYIKELSKLQDDVNPLDKETVMAAIEDELKCPIEQLFSDVSQEHLASASVAQTHRAVLLNGDEVVLKIQRPHIQEQITEDLALLVRLARHFPKHLLPMVDLPKILQQLQTTLLNEIDFRNEAKYMDEFAQYNQDIPCVGVPKVYPEFTTPHLIVEEYIPSVRINQYAVLQEAGYDLADIGQKLMLSFIKQVFKDGFFHGDPHPGNLLIYEGKIYFIDFGIMGELETGFRVSLNDMLSSFTTQDIDSMTQAILTITTTSEPINKLQLEQDIERMLTKYGNLELGSLSITDMFEDVVAICRRHHLQVPSQMAILEKAALQIEGLFRELAPNINLMTLAKEYFLENMKSDILHQTLSYDSFLIELLYLLRHGKSIPRRLHQLVEQVVNGRLVVNHDLIDYNQRFRRIESLTNRLVLSLVFLALLLTGGMLTFNPELLLLARSLFALAGLVLIWIFYLIIQSTKK